MSRPTLVAIDREDTDWLTNLEANLAKLLDTPLPILKETVVGNLPNAKLYNDCFALVNDVLYQSNGTSWVTKQLDFIADLDTGTAVLGDIVTAYNDLLADLQLKGWMA